jgi:phage shock protein PspC (stress-responsive transcriptional regulator)
VRDPETMETTETIRRLERPKDGRWLGGVCTGLGEYFDLSPALYRIAFAALAFAGGTGIVLYAAAWLVIPEAGAPDSIAAAELKKHRDHPNRVLGFALLAAILIAVLSSIRVWPSPGNFWVVTALLLVAVAWWRGRIVLGILLALVVVPIAGLLLAVRVPFSSGVGERTEHPALASEVHSKYTLGVGRLDLDLANVQLPKGQTFVRAEVGVGKLRVIVPTNASVEVDGRAQAGDVILFGQKESGSHVHSHVIERTGSGRVLDLDLHTGLGKITVERP